MVLQQVEGLGGHQQEWSIAEQLGALCQEDRLEEVVEHTRMSAERGKG